MFISKLACQALDDFDNQCAADLSWYFHFWLLLLMLPGLLLDERVITGSSSKFAFSTSVVHFCMAVGLAQTTSATG